MTQPTVGLSGAEPDDAETPEVPVHDFNSAGRLAVSWLWDSGEKRVLVLTGPADSHDDNDDGSMLMAATLVELSSELPDRSRLHAQASARGLNATVLTWILAAQLGLCAATPAELALRLSADPRPVTILVSDIDASGPGQLGWETRRIIDELLRPLLTIPGVRLVIQTAHTGLFSEADILTVPQYPGMSPEPRPHLAALGTTAVQDALMGGTLVALCSDPRIAVEAHPITLAVAATTVLRHLPDAMQTQLETFGQGLVTTEPPHGYVLHHAAAVATEDEDLQRALEPHIAQAPMRAAWARWRPAPGLITPDWPGAVTELALQSDGRSLLMTDRSGRTHLLNLADGTELGRIPSPRIPADDLPTAEPKTRQEGPWQLSASAAGALVVRHRDFEADVLNVNLGWTPTATLLHEDGTVLVGGRHGLLCFRPVTD